MSENSSNDQSYEYIRAQINESIAVRTRMLSDADLLSSLQRVVDEIISAFERGNKVLLAGNGGSAADSQHIAAEFVSRFMYDRPGLPAMALTTDTSMLTAIGNDYGFENLFKRQLEANGRGGDVFIAITTSGESKNILRACECAKERGIVTVGLTGSRGVLREVCDHVLAVPSISTPRIQEAHITLGHIICGLVEQRLFPNP